MVKKFLTIGIIILFIGMSISSSSFDMEGQSIISFFVTMDPPEEEWNRTYGGNNWDSTHSILQTPDGGFIILGYTLSFGNGGDIWLIKTDEDGIEQWNKTFDGIGYYDGGSDILKTSDDGYIITGFITNMPGPPKDFIINGWLIKLDSNFNEQWNKTFGGDSNASFSSIQQLGDEGYIILGDIRYESDKDDIWIIKTDKDGIEQWNKTFGNNMGEHGKSLLLTSDGGFIIIGSKQKNIDPYDVDIWLLKLDENGNMLWNKTFGGSNWDWGYSILEINDFGYFLLGCSGPFQESDDIWLIKTDCNGTEQWNKTFGGVDDDVGESIIQTLDGEYIIIGYTDSFGAGSRDAWLIKIDGNGSEIWNKTCGGFHSDSGQSIIQTMQGDYIVTGTTTSFGAGYLDAWLFKLSYSVLPNKVFVDDDFDENTSGWGYNHFDKIQDGINAVNEGGTVYVYDGIYYENIFVNHNITLIGEDKYTTTIDGNNIGDVVYITKNASGGTITGFKIRNSGFEELEDAGIEVWGYYDKIDDNIITENYYGINILSDYGENLYCRHISNNKIYSNLDDGIILRKNSGYVTPTDVFNNYIAYNSAGITVVHDDYYDDYEGIRNNIYENTINNNIYGILVSLDINQNIFNNTIHQNNNGIIFSGYHGLCYNNKVYYNIIESNVDGFILSDACSGSCYDNEIISNNFIDNVRGIFLSTGDCGFCPFNNKFLQNNFINNVICASIKLSNKYIFGRNIWNGNYWNRPRILPKIISDFGLIFPLFNIDWHPAKKPYDI